MKENNKMKSEQPAESSDNKQNFPAQDQKYYFATSAADQSNNKQRFQVQDQKYYFAAPVAASVAAPAQNQKFYYTTPASTYALEPSKRYYVFADQSMQYYNSFDGFPSVSLNPGFNFQPAQTFLARSSGANNDIQANLLQSADGKLNPRTDAIAAVVNDPSDPSKTMAFASAPTQPESPDLQGRISSVELSTVVSSQVQNKVPLVISEARSQVTVPSERRSSSENGEGDQSDSDEKRRKEPSIAQAKPTAIAVAGPGGVASSR